MYDADQTTVTGITGIVVNGCLKVGMTINLVPFEHIEVSAKVIEITVNDKVVERA